MTVENCAVVRPGFPRPFPNTSSNVIEQLKLNGKVAVVTGAADGIGLAVAEGYAEAGAYVVFWYNTNEAAVQKAEEVAKLHGVKTKAYKVDGKQCLLRTRTNLLSSTPGVTKSEPEPKPMNKGANMRVEIRNTQYQTRSK